MLRLWLFFICFSMFHTSRVVAIEPINNGQNFCETLVTVISEQKKLSDPSLTPEKIHSLLQIRGAGAIPTGESFNVLVELVKDLQKNDSTDKTNPKKIDACKERYSQLYNIRMQDFWEADNHDEKNEQNRKADDYVEIAPTTQLFILPDVHSTNPVVVTTPVVDDCLELADYKCEAGQGDFERLANFFDNLEKSKQCKCLPEKLEIIHGSRFNELKDEALKALKEAAEKQIAKKMLNNFSSYYEDVSYFAANSKEFFGKKNKDQKSKSSELKCVDSKKYNKAIDDKCKGKVSSAEKQKRIANIFNAFGDNNPESKLDPRFSDLITKIEKLDNEAVDKKGSPYTRQDHDKARHSLALTDQQFIFADNFIKKIVSDTSFSKAITENPEVPYFAITKLIDQKVKENPSKFLKDYIDPKEVGNAFYKAMSNSLSDPKSISDAIKISISVSMGLHPGFDSIMRDKSLLFSVVEDAKKQNKSLMKTLEEGDSLLLDKFEKECKKVIESFASAVCLEVEKIPSLIS